MDYVPMPDGLTPHCALCLVTQDSQFRFIMMISHITVKSLQILGYFRLRKIAIASQVLQLNHLNP